MLEELVERIEKRAEHLSTKARYMPHSEPDSLSELADIVDDACDLIKDLAAALRALAKEE